MTYDQKPPPVRPLLTVAGDLVRRDDALSKEAAKRLRDAHDEIENLRKACRVGLEALQLPAPDKTYVGYTTSKP